ncbi:hypothetical protein L1887_05545 [Cichorium endivia]|nr:hypothetical protein L1887_05545 [Cichorium endivia]
MSSSGVRWSWRITPCNSDEISQLSQLLHALSSFSVSPLPDSWICPLTSDSVFRVAPVRCAIDSLISVLQFRGGVPGSPSSFMLFCPGSPLLDL